MAARKLEKDDWFGYFETLSKSRPEAEVEIEVMGEDIGDQYSVEWVPWRGVTYDFKEGHLEVFTDTLAHRIPNPQEIWVDETEDQPLAIQVLDSDGHKQIIQLRASQ